MEWQPIDSAPKDGYFLIFGGTWKLPGEIQDLPLDFVTACERVNGEFIGDFTESGGQYEYKPTYWMPLPEPPK